MRTLFLQAPSFDGFDGGAGARYQTKREVASFWYPTWLAQPAALVPDSKLIDAPPHDTSLAEVVAQAKNFDLAVVHTSTPSFASDVKAITALKDANPALKVGLIGAKAAVDAEGTLKAAPVVDFAARNEFDFTIKDVADGRDWKSILGLSYRDANGQIQHTPDRPILENMDDLPFVTPVYKRDLDITKYFGGYLKHPYMSFYTGRGCKSRCTFCLWPQTVGGHRYRTRSVGHVIDEMKWAKAAFPEVKEFFFDDDTFTDDLPRAEAIARELGKLGVTWSCNAKANVPRATLKVLRDNGLRLLLVGYESGNQQILHNIKKGMRVDVAKRFAKDCRELGIRIHGTFILGLPGETQETIKETIAFAKEVNPHTLQVSLAAPYPGTFLYKQALENGWLDDANGDLVNEDGRQIAPSELSGPEPHRDFRFGRRLLPQLLFPPGQDRLDRRRDGPKPGGHEAAASRGCGVLPFLARAARDGALKYLIVTADDFGLADEVNQAIERAHVEGVLTAASLMVGAPATAAAVELARRLPRLAVGLHLALVDAKPVLPPSAVPDLVDGRGRFRANMALSGAAMFFLPHVRRQMRAEIRAQFEAFRATGLKLDHVNAHKHFHLHPSILSAILELAKEFGVHGRSRAFRASRRSWHRIEGERRGLTGLRLAAWRAFSARVLKRAGVAAPDQVFGLAWSGAMTHSRLSGLIAHLPEGVTEIYTHPATSSGFAGAAPGYRYEEELAALTSPALRRQIAEAGVASGGFSDAAKWNSSSSWNV